MANSFQTAAAKNRYYAGRARDTTNFEIAQSRSRADQRIASVGARYGLMSDAISNIGQTLTTTIGNYYQFRAQQDTMALEIAKEGRAYELDMLRETRLGEQQKLLNQKTELEIDDLRRQQRVGANDKILKSKLTLAQSTLVNNRAMEGGYDSLAPVLKELNDSFISFGGEYSAEVGSAKMAFDEMVNNQFSVSVGGSRVPMATALRIPFDSTKSPELAVESVFALRDNTSTGVQSRGVVKLLDGIFSGKVNNATEAAALTPELNGLPPEVAAEFFDANGALKMDRVARVRMAYQTEERFRDLALITGNSVDEVKDAYKQKMRGLPIEEVRKELAAIDQFRTEAKKPMLDATTPPAPLEEVNLPPETPWRKFTLDGSPEGYRDFAAESVASGQAATRALGSGNKAVKLKPAEATAMRRTGDIVGIGTVAFNAPYAGHVKVSEAEDAAVTENYSPIVSELAKKNPDMTLQHAAIVTTLDDLVKVMSSTKSPVQFKKAFDLLDGTISQAKVVDQKTRAPVPGIVTDVLTEAQVKTITDRAAQMGVSAGRVASLTAWLADYKPVSPEKKGVPATIKALGAAQAGVVREPIIVNWKGKKRSLDPAPDAVVDYRNKTITAKGKTITWDEFAQISFPE